MHKRILVGAIAGIGISAALLPTGVSAYRRWRDATHRMQLSDFVQTGDKESPYVLTPRASAALVENEAEGAEEEVSDDALLRKMANRNYYGEKSPDSADQLARIARREAQRWSDLMPKNQAIDPRAKDAAPLSVLQTPGKQWVNLGPTDARFQFNGTEYLQVDSGRTTGILVHPGNANIAYTSTSGGGIWKTFTFQEKNPVWYPITETIGNLAIGAIAMDPNDPETIYAGLGDFTDSPSGHMIKSTNGGVTWSEPVRLEGVYPETSGGSEGKATSVRAIAVDPANSDIVLAGSDWGMFRSVDGGKTWTLVDMANAGSQGQESVWTIVHAGTINGVSRWVASGESGAGDIWTSSDAGVTWESRAAAGALPATNVTRIDMGGGTPAADGTTVIYAQVAAADGSSGAGIWRSTDSGATFVNVTGTLRNPTLSTNCRSQNVQTGQAWYDQTVGVDPGNNNNVLIGGSLCAIRTVNGTAATPVWELVAHWLPSGNNGQTADGRLPYVHADYHEMKIVRLSPSSYMAIAGTDGGLFVSRNVFTTAAVIDRNIRWDYPNRGIVSHLFYNIASGDEHTGSPFLVYGGLQDNGTRFRDSPQFPTSFNQIIGGDGFGSAASEVPGDRVYWGSVYNVSIRVCDPDAYDCNRGESWFVYGPTNDYPTLPCSGDSTAGQFYTRVQPIRTATAATGPAVLTVTDKGVWRYVTDPFYSTNSWELLGNPSGPLDSGACSSGTHRNMYPSTVWDGLIGVATSGGRFRVTSNCTLTTPSNECTWTRSNLLSVDLDNSGSITNEEIILSTSSIDFPPGATGKPLGDVYVVASVAEITNAGTPVPDAMGHVFITQDRGQTWQPLKGNGTSDLPNLPVDVIRYDPSDTTNQTIYVGNYIGVYRTTDGGQTWHRFGAGMPMVWVRDLFVSRTGAFVRAATFGRGLWEIYPSATADKGVNGNGDWDRNLQIDFQDILATSSRLGSSPATTEVPFYEWNQDLTGQVNGIDDADLAAVLQRFGGRP
ncbi:WD40/YVTN/BNR-like repeat-containing protein [Hyalangium gracile]|uniref:WD40/YVTN/BNR-like repeat-containing protein n=1 Tax=Hyalangium gracile TaxID=394092 RepID=UPI001CC9B280|nr:sialidase family protein [Hyalangium gracile]